MNLVFEIIRPKYSPPEMEYAVAHDDDDGDDYICARVKVLPKDEKKHHPPVKLFAQIYGNLADIPPSHRKAKSRVRAMADFRAGKGLWLFPRIPGALVAKGANLNYLAVWAVFGRKKELRLVRHFLGVNKTSTECSLRGPVPKVEASAGRA